MQRFLSRPFSYLFSLLACTVMAFSTGCASGGFKLTRDYAGFVNKQNIFLRIILYIFTGIVFAVTLLVDMVIFNTMDFWNGQLSQGTYEFNKEGKTYVAKHEILPGGLKRSTITIYGEEHKTLQVVVLRELQNGDVELLVDGKLRTRVNDISSLPVASIFDTNGTLLSKEVIPFGVSTLNTASRN